MTRRDVAGAGAVTLGLALFLVFGDLEGGRDDAALGGWLIAGGACAGCATLLVVSSAGRSPAARAALLGTATGVLFGLTAALMQATIHRFEEDGLLSVLIDWRLYAFAIVGLTGMWLSQAALQTGALAPAMATMSSFDPITSVALGLGLLDEGFHDTTLGIGAGLVGLAIVVAGIVVLAYDREPVAAGEPARATP